MMLMTTPAGSSHRFRIFFASVLGLVASWILVSSILVVWLNRTLTDTKTFTSTFAPLSHNKAIQEFLTTNVTDAIVHGASNSDAAAQLVPGQDFSSADSEQIAKALRPVVLQNVSAIVRSEMFSSLWQHTVTDFHTSMKKQLESDSKQILLDFSPTANAIVDQLKTGALAPLANSTEIDTNKAKLSIESDSLDNIRRAYKLFKATSVVWIVLGIVCAGGAIALSVDHARTFRRISMLTGMGSLLLALGFYTATRVPAKVGTTGGQAAQALIGTLLHDVQRTSIIIGVICIAAALMSKAVSLVRSQRTNKSASAAKANAAPKNKGT